MPPPGIVRGADVVGDNDALFEVGETWGFTAQHTVTQAEIDAGGNFDGPDADSLFDQLRNVATADSNETGPDTDDASVPVDRTPSLNIVKDVSSVTGGTAGGAADSVGDVIHYAITVANTGNTTLTGLTVTDPFADAPPGIVRGADVVGDNDALFEVGETWGFTAQHTVTQAEIDAGGNFDGPDADSLFDQLRNVATADSNETGPDTDDASVPVDRTPSLNIVKDVSSVTGGTAGGAADSVGDVIHYAITVANTGNTTLTGLTVTDPFADAPPGIVRGADVVGDNDALFEVGETWGFTAQHTVTQAEIDAGGNFDGPDADSLFDQLRNVATADSNETGPDTDDASVPVDRTPSLNIVKDVSSVTGGTAGGAADSVGDVIHYAITVANTGNTTLTGLTVTDPFADAPPGIVRGADVVGDNDALFEVGETWGFTAQHTVTQAEIDAGGNFDGPDADSLFDQLRNVATADSNETGPDTDDASVPVDRTPSLNIVKDVSSVTGGTAGGAADSVGDVIHYAITVANTGNTTLTGLTVTDPFADAPPGIVRGADVVGDNDALFEVGETWGFTAQHTVTQAEIDAGGNFDGPDADSLFDQLRNVATADSNETGPDTDDASVPVDRTPSLNIVKDVSSVTGGTAGGAADSVGDVIHYAITVANTGNTTLTGLTVTDSFADAPPGIVRGADVVGDNDALFEVGETWGFTAQHTVTQAEIDAGGNFDGPDADSLFDQLRNVATADSNETGPDTDDASVPVDRTPSLNIVKDVSSVTGGTAGGAADSVGDVIHYAITVANTGNTTLTGLTVTDPFADAPPGIVRGADVVGDNDALFEVGETWGFTAQHTVTQAEIDAGGNFDGPDADSLFDQLRNVATADSNETGPDTDDASVPVDRTPSLNIVKDVSSVTGGTAGGAADSVGDVIHYAITVANTGNTTLTGLTVTDPFADAPPGIVRGADVVGDNDALFEVGETWGFTAQHTVTQAEIDAGGNFDGPDADSLFDQLRNVATADSNETGPDTDDASVPVEQPPPAAGQGATPGFWKNHPDIVDEELGELQPALSVNSAYETVFSVEWCTRGTPTLLDALGTGGGGLNALLRHSTASFIASAVDAGADPDGEEGLISASPRRPVRTQT